jgi:hypothetical protein
MSLQGFLASAHIRPGNRWWEQRIKFAELISTKKNSWLLLPIKWWNQDTEAIWYGHWKHYKARFKAYPLDVGSSRSSCTQKEGVKLRRFFLRIKARKGHNVAVVALARKILCILYHLLINQETYQEDGVTKSRQYEIDWPFARTDKMSLQTMIEIIAKEGYEAKKIDRYGG